ncbi:acyl-CoA thioesterase [Actinocorallia libanotica]|uniref:Thioesterase domain-containing protein n=1 Tax=Actinocorallia libanotica TaxID=46162 RepID=A0ABN1Q6M2_9ACTN
MQVVHAELDWKDSIKTHDRVEVLVGTARIGTKSFTLDFAFRKDGRITCTGEIVYAVVSPEAAQAVPVPARLAEALAPVDSLRERLGSP